MTKNTESDFWNKVDRNFYAPGDCWNWIGKLNNGGYGTWCFDNKIGGSKDRPFSKLTDTDIPIIRQMNTDGETYDVIAELFGISVHTVFDIIKGRKWKHV